MQYQLLSFLEVISRYKAFHKKVNNFELRLLRKLDKGRVHWYTCRMPVAALKNVVLPYHRESGCGGTFRMKLWDKTLVPLKGASLSKTIQKLNLSPESSCIRKITDINRLSIEGPIILMYENRPISISHLFLGRCRKQLVCVDGLHRLLARAANDDGRLVDVMIATHEKYDYESIGENAGIAI